MENKSLQLKMVTIRHFVKLNRFTCKRYRTIQRVMSRTDHVPQIEDSDSLNRQNIYLQFIGAKHG